MHLAVVSPLDATRLIGSLGLVPSESKSIAFGHGGHSVTELVLALAEQVDRLDLITLDPGLDRPLEFRGSNIRLCVGPFRPSARERARDLFAAERRFIVDHLRRLGPTVASAHWTYEYALGALDTGLPTLVTVRDWAPTILRYQADKYRAVRLLMQALCFRRGRHFAAVSPYMARRVQGVVRGSVPVLPNSLGRAWSDTEPASLRSELVVAVNNGFGRLKNVQVLLAAWPSVRAAVPSARLLLAGEGYGPDGPAARWATDRRREDGVTFVGQLPREHLQSLLSGARVFVHPSREESFGMVVLEAMSTGVPVVGGDRSGAVPWLLENGAGVTVDIRDRDAVAMEIVDLLRNDGRASTIAARGRRRAIEEFSAPNVAKAYTSQLEALQ